MKERPILFSGEMVRAILDGRKTMTRRIVTPQFSQKWGCGCPNKSTFTLMNGDQEWKDAFAVHVDRLTPTGHWQWVFCPYGKPGDRLWVRETWAQVGMPGTLSGYIRYKADEQNAVGAYGAQKWKPSIFMPRWASRITLEITGVRVERLQDISEENAEAEGCTGDHRADRDLDAAQEFRSLWDSINGKRASWTSNPWVWVIEFKRAEVTA